VHVRSIDEKTRAAVIELQQMVADYWHEVDTNNAAAAPEFFTEDGVFDVGNKLRYEGRAGVRAFYDQRALRGQRTTRHTFTNLRVELESPNSAKVSYIVTNYGADGPAPVTDFDGPSLVSQIEARCIRNAEGVWRIAALRGDPMFIGKEPYTRQVLVKS
jgi:ketosteroid isomerase-like protein